MTTWVLSPDDAKWETLIDGIEYIGTYNPREDLNVTGVQEQVSVYTITHNDDNGKIFRYTTAGTVDSPNSRQILLFKIC